MSEGNNKTGTVNKHTVVGVRFKPCSKIYLFEVNGVDPEPGMLVVAESEMGIGLGRVVKPKHVVEEPEQPLKKILRIASEKDIETDRNNRPFEDEAKAFCIERVKARNLPMKIIATETTLDRKRLIFYFTAEGRIDFRELVRDLAAKFKTRIEMRQIGVRDEVKMIGGIGVCGRQTCCSLFLETFEPISIRMAKEQDLIINQNKLSGICGRLMCCLGYEYEMNGKATPAAAEEPQPDSLPEHAELQPSHVCECESYPCPEPQSQQVTEEDRPKKIMPRKKQRGKKKFQPSGLQAEGAERVEPDEEGKRKGKPFSKRRNFLKKKRRK